MLNLNVLIGICLFTPCILALSCLEPQKNIDIVETELETFEQLADEEPVVKINWIPVWDDIEGNNELVSRTQDSQKDNCDAPNGLGLKNLIQQVDKLLPKEEIKKIVKLYSEDPEIKALKAFAKNPETQKMVKAIKNSKEYQLLKDYSCRILHLDLNANYNLVRSLINPSITRADITEHKGIRGLLNAVEAVLPLQEIHELYESLMKTDDELVKAVDNLRSPEFQQLLLNLKDNVAEYQEMREQLIALGVPLEEMRGLIAKSMDWSQGVNTFL